MYSQKFITLVLFLLCIHINFINSYETSQIKQNDQENNSNFIHSIINADVISDHEDAIQESSKYRDNEYNYINKPVKNNLRGRKPIDQIFVYDSVSVRLSDFDEGNVTPENNDIDNENTSNMKKKLRKKKTKPLNNNNEGESNMIDEILSMDTTTTTNQINKSEDRQKVGGNLPMKRKNKRKPRPNFEKEDD